MDRNGKGRFKILWAEKDELHSVWASSYSEQDGWVKANLMDGRTLLLAKATVLKVEQGEC